MWNYQIQLKHMPVQQNLYVCFCHVLTPENTVSATPRPYFLIFAHFELMLTSRTFCTTGTSISHHSFFVVCSWSDCKCLLIMGVCGMRCLGWLRRPGVMPVQMRICILLCEWIQASNKLHLHSWLPITQCGHFFTKHSWLSQAHFTHPLLLIRLRLNQLSYSSAALHVLCLHRWRHCLISITTLKLILQFKCWE